MDDSRDTLSFSFLDDLALAAVRRRGDLAAHLRSKHINRLGPLIELLGLHRSGLLPFDALPLCTVRRALLQALSPEHVGRGAHTTVKTARIGFITTNRNVTAENQTEEQLQWLAFCRKAQDAAELSLPKHVAQGLIGAMREIEENVHIHSERAHDGVVSYRGTTEEFEFVIGDSGIGILKSLRQSPDYAHLLDAGQAIQVALRDGQSRFRHINPDRGYGFRDLFIGLANLNGELRFRSDDHALFIDGASPALITAKLHQKAPLQGFIASIVCRLRPASTLQ